jgi:uncharacterized membrane protein YfhO
MVDAVLSDPAFDPAQTVMLNLDAPDLPMAAPVDVSSESVVIDSYEDDTIVLKVNASSDGAVVVSETFEEGWHATVDGKKVPVEQAYGVIRTIPVSAGSHTIVLTYDPWSLRYGFYLSLLAAVLSVGVIVWFLVRRHEATVHEVEHQ